jgi:hypothetical protein
MSRVSRCRIIFSWWGDTDSARLMPVPASARVVPSWGMQIKSFDFQQGVQMIASAFIGLKLKLSTFHAPTCQLSKQNKLGIRAKSPARGTNRQCKICGSVSTQSISTYSSRSRYNLVIDSLHSEEGVTRSFKFCVAADGMPVFSWHSSR